MTHTLLQSSRWIEDRGRTFDFMGVNISSVSENVEKMLLGKSGWVILSDFMRKVLSVKKREREL